MMRTWAMALMATALFLFTAGCGSYIRVDSEPQGAKVLVDGQWTGRVTPAELLIRDIPLGIHTITLEKDGYRTASPPKQIQISVDGFLVFASIIGPEIFALPALAGDLWKKPEVEGAYAVSWDQAGFENHFSIKTLSS